MTAGVGNYLISFMFIEGHAAGILTFLKVSTKVYDTAQDPFEMTAWVGNIPMNQIVFN